MNNQQRFLELLFTEEEIRSGCVIRYREMARKKSLAYEKPEKNGFCFAINPINIIDNVIGSDIRIYPEYFDSIPVEKYPELVLYTGNANTQSVKVCRTFAIEFDNGDLEKQKEFIKTKIKKINFVKPTAIVFSGKKSLHVFFTLDFDQQPYSVDEWKLIQKFLIKIFSDDEIKADSAITSPHNKMRLGGVQDDSRVQSLLYAGQRIARASLEIALNENGFEKFKENNSQKTEKIFEILNLNVSDKSKNKFIEFEVRRVIEKCRIELAKGNRNRLLFFVAVKAYKALLIGYIDQKLFENLLSDFIRSCKKLGDFSDDEISNSLLSAKRTAAADIENWTK